MFVRFLTILVFLTIMGCESHRQESREEAQKHAEMWEEMRK